MSRVQHAFVIGMQIHVILESGHVYTLARVGDNPNGVLEWRELPPVPRSEAAEVAENAAAVPTP